MAMKLVDTEQLESDLTSVADSIRAKTGGADALAFPSGFVSAVEGIESADSALVKIEYDMTNGYTNYNLMFNKKTWLTEVPMGLIQHISNGVYLEQVFSGASNLVEIPSFDFPNATSMAYFVSHCTNLERIGVLNTPSVTNTLGMFSSCDNLHTIEGINITNATNVNNMFAYCYNLENITFNGVIKVDRVSLSHCTNLTHDSLMSAINALYDWASEGSTSTYTLTLGSTNLAKLTDAEKAIATQRGWTLA